MKKQQQQQPNPNPKKRGRQQQLKGTQQQQQQQQMKGTQQQLLHNPNKKMKQQGQPPRQKALFPNSYASFEQIPNDLKTGRDSYLIYFNTLNNTFWYYPSLNLDITTPYEVIHDIEDFPYHPNFKYYYVTRNKLFKVTPTTILHHEIDGIINGEYDGPIQTVIKYTLNFSKVPGRYVSAWELLNNKQPRPIYMERFLELLLPFEEEQRKRRQLQQQKQRQKRRQQQQRKNMQRQDRGPEPQQMQQIYPEQYQSDITQQL